MKTEIKHRTALYLTGLSVLCWLLLIYGIGRLPLIGPDEPRYAAVAGEMLESGDWITPRLAGIQWFEKPALVYWLSALGFKAFGVSEFSARIGVALMAAGGVFLLFFFGASFRSRLFGILSASSLVSTGLWVGFARGATSDMPLAVSSALALLSFFWWDQQRVTDEKRNLGWYVCCFAIGMAVLAKGLVGIVLPGAIIVAYTILTRRMRILLNHPGLLVAGALICLLTASTWYGPMFWRHGGAFFEEFFVAHHFERYFSDKYRHPQPFYFFVLVVLGGSFPWLAYLFLAAKRDVLRGRELFAEPANRLRLFLWLWCLIPLVFFSFSSSKLPGYILPIFPPIALLVGLELEEADKNRRWPSLVTALCLVVAAIILGWRGTSELGVSGRDVGIVSVVAIISAGIYLGLSYWRDQRMAALALPYLLAVVVVITSHLLFPGLGERESIRDLARLAERTAKPGEKLVFFLNTNQGINFYATTLPLRDEKAEPITLGHEDQVADFLAQRRMGSVLLMSYQRWIGGLLESDRISVEVLGSQHLGISCSPGCDWVLLRVSQN